MVLGGLMPASFGTLSVILIAMVTTVTLASPAYADPPTPPTPPSASDSAKRLAAAQHEAEQLTEQWHAAQDRMEAKQGEAQRAKAAVESARRAALEARANEDRFRVQADQVAADALEGGRLDQLHALVLSDSPNDFLDQMTTLDIFTADQLAVLEHMAELVAVSTRAQADADSAATRAQRVADEARVSVQEIGMRKKQADARIEQAEKLLGLLSPAERAARTRDTGAPVGVVLGNSKGAMALRVAMTRISMPYMWGATGPNAFDCSGLMYWAFKAVGIILPRSADAQSLVGRPVARSDLQPGDMVFFYTPVSHVGFYAGNGKVLNAVQTGDFVRYSDLDRMDYHSARRL